MSRFPLANPEKYHYFSGTRWHIGRFDRSTGAFSSESSGHAGCGPSLSVDDAAGRRIQICSGPLELPGAGYTGVQSLPKWVRLSPAGNSLLFSASPELATLHGESRNFTHSSPGTLTLLKPSDRFGLHMHMRASIESSARCSSVSLGNDHGAVVIVAQCAAAKVVLRALVGATDQAQSTAVTQHHELSVDGTTHTLIDVFVDGGVTSFFLQDGEKSGMLSTGKRSQLLDEETPPVLPTGTGATVTVSGGAVNVELTLWRMNRGIAECPQQQSKTDDGEGAELTRTAACPGYLPPGTPATGGAKNMVLVYMDFRSELGFDGHPPCDCPGPHYPSMVWNASNFSSLLRYSADDSSPGAKFFDSFLMLGTEWRNGVKFNWERAYVNDSSFKDQRHAVMGDWLGLLDVFMRGVKNLEAAALLTNTNPTFVITIPYPDKRAVTWGSVGGRDLNFSKASDQIAGVSWYVSRVVASVAALKLKRAKMTGFYWLNEGVDRLDHPMIRAAAAAVHKARPERLFLMWIPSYRASFKVDFGGWREWRDIGFDFVTLQPNWAFANVPPGLNAQQKFALVANQTQCLGLGVEMELPMAVRNPLAGTWTQSFDAYAAASRRYNWGTRAMRTWYYGNSFNQMRQASPEYHAKLYELVTGRSKTDDAPVRSGAWRPSRGSPSGGGRRHGSA